MGRLRSHEACGILDGALGRAACRPRRLHWVVVRRRFNTAADEAAAEGCQEAARAAVRGDWRPR
eukprot:10365416-Lingulodinium_polyedra.AAC.1